LLLISELTTRDEDMTGQSVQPTWWNSWKLGFGGSVVAGLLLLFLFRPLFCFYTFQFPSASVVTVVSGIVSGILASALKTLEVKFVRPLAYILMGLLITLALAMLIIPFFTQLNMNYCVPDLPVFVDMIEQEEEAVIARDMSAIHSIYDPSAVVARADTLEYWQAYTYYSQKFAREEHCSVKHADFLVQEFSGEQVRLTTSSRGIYGIGGQGCTIAYANPPGSDEWTFQKIDGKWKIVFFEFNKKSE